MTSDPIVTMALLGATRAAGPQASPHPVVSDVWSQLDWQNDPAHALLQASAILGTATVAGTQSFPGRNQSEACALETQPLCPMSSRTHLKQMLAGEHLNCLSEWLQLCHATGQIVPPETLPALLDRGARDKTLRPLIYRCVGERGFWLARQNETWGYLVAPDRLPANAWETGTPNERSAVFEELRSRDTAVAREKLAATWEQETPEFKATCLEKMSGGLTADDVPLLENALTDRRKEVRLSARLLLARLPGSPLVERMQQRAGDVLKLTSHFLSRRWEIVFPTSFVPEWKKDGLEEKPAGGKGEKSFWCRQILGLVPITWYAQHFDLKIRKMVEMAVASDDWDILLLESWMDSLSIMPNPEAAFIVAESILKHQKIRDKLRNWSERCVGLMKQCQAELQWQLLSSLAGHSMESDYYALYWKCFEHYKGDLNKQQASLVLQQLRPALNSGSYLFHSDWAAGVAMRFPPEMIDAITHDITGSPPLHKPAEAFMQTLNFRATMRRALTTR